MPSNPRIVILGGGFAGLESAFLLRMRLHGKVDLTIVSDREDFTFKPNTIYIPFGADPSAFLIPLRKPLDRRHIDFVSGSVTEVDPVAKRVSVSDGTVLPYDKLVIATGSDMRPDEIPGLREHAETIWTSDAMLSLGRRLEDLRTRARGGERQRVLFLVPPNNKCAGPLYEMVFMIETHLRREGLRDMVHLEWSTFEGSYIQAFGPRLDEVVRAEFAERGVEGHTSEVVTEVAAGTVRYADGSSREFDHLIAFPPYVAAEVYPGLPADDRGFLTCDPATRQVQGHADVYAPGDAGDFPVKQAFLALLQADAVAEHIAAGATAREFTAGFDPVSMCVMEMFDKATFAQVPLRVTGDPAHPVEVRPGAEDDYKVGVSPAWRIGKKVLGFYLPMRFGAGEPFHAGTAWSLMDVGLKGMAGVLAD